MKHKFKVGDKVRNLSTGYFREYGEHKLVEFGTVTDISNIKGPYVLFDGCHTPYFCRKADIAIVNEQEEQQHKVFYVVYNTQEADVPEIYTDSSKAIARMSEDQDLAVTIVKV